MTGIVNDDLARAGMHAFAHVALDEGADAEILAAAMLHEGVTLLLANRGPLRRHEVAQALRRLAFVVERGEQTMGTA